jgi:hypothetical protein
MCDIHVQRFLTGLSGLALFVGASGCSNNTDNCYLTFLCDGVVTTGGETGGKTSSVGAGSGPPGCEKSPSEDPSVVRNECGYFVSSSAKDFGSLGTLEEPVKTLSSAIELAIKGPKRVYACADAFEESIRVPAGVEIYGGLDCENGWVPSNGLKTKLTAAAGEVPLRLDEGEGLTKIEDFEVTARDAPAAGNPSSIAAIAANVELELARCIFIAGNGRAGANGAHGTDPSEAAPPGDPGAKVCANATGGPGGENTCGDYKTNGGIGGLAGKWISDDVTFGPEGGGNGEPAGDGSENGGAAYEGGGWTCPDGSLGGPGAPGVEGQSGMGGRWSVNGSPAGIFNIDKGLVGADGLPGSDGTPGQGGGGGGGRSWGYFCGKDDKAGNGPAGAGGGAGGCGGVGGTGGQAGGSSIALVSLGEKQVTLVDVILQTGAGGKGGNGGSGKPGQKGGDGGAALWIACSGGKGGEGGHGGHGGGGAGGHSIGIAHLFGLISVTNTKFQMQNAGPGAGGESESANGAGEAGTWAQTVKFVNK